MTITKGQTMKVSRLVIQAPCLLGLWLGVGLQAHAQTDTVTYVYTDPQGTPLVEADAQGNVIARYDYTPYGNAVTSLGSPPNGPGYTGHVNDPETGLVYMQARYYDPAIGRFISRDPAGQKAGFNDYAYVSDNPINKIDPSGMFQCNNKASCDAGMRLRSDFQKAQQHYKSGSPAYNSLAAGIKALGTANDGGAIQVATVNAPNQTALGWGAAPKGQTPTLTINLAQLNAQPNTQQGEADFAATGRHEIQHVMDDMVAGDKPRDPVSEFWHEVRGVRAETSIWEGMNQSDPWRTWTTNGGLDMKQVYSEAQTSTDAYCPGGKCP
jgi:RHS repeat-associated protein